MCDRNVAARSLVDLEKNFLHQPALILTGNTGYSSYETSVGGGGGYWGGTGLDRSLL